MNFAKMLGFALMVMALTVLGCNKQDGGKADSSKKDSATAKDAKSGEKKTDDHVHGTGPNGGVVFDLGKYHGEFTIDHAKKEATIFVLGSDEKTPTAVECKELTLNTKETKSKDGKVVPSMTIKMLPQGEIGGKASKFVGTDPGLGIEAEHEGTVLGTINGKNSQGEFKEGPETPKKGK